MNIKLAELCYAEISKLDGKTETWDMLTDIEKQPYLDGVEFYLNNPDAESADGHANWMGVKSLEGWYPGAQTTAPDQIADPLYLLKTHEGLKPWNKLDDKYKAKHRIFCKTVRANS